MALRVTNLAHGRRADLSNSNPTGLVIGYGNNAGLNQQWTFGVNGLGSVRAVAQPAVRVGADPAAVNFAVFPRDNQVYGGGPQNDFQIIPVNIAGVIRHIIATVVGGVELRWTLEDGENSTPVRVKPPTGQPNGPANANTQYWTLTAA